MEDQPKPAEKPNLYDRLFMKAHNRLNNPKWQPTRGAYMMLWQAAKAIRDGMKELWVSYLEQLNVARAFQDTAEGLASEVESMRERCDENIRQRDSATAKLDELAKAGCTLESYNSLRYQLSRANDRYEALVATNVELNREMIRNREKQDANKESYLAVAKNRDELLAEVNKHTREIRNLNERIRQLTEEAIERSSLSISRKLELERLAAANERLERDRGECEKSLRNQANEITRLHAKVQEYGAKINELILGCPHFAEAAKLRTDLGAANEENNRQGYALKMAEEKIAAKDLTIATLRKNLLALEGNVRDRDRMLDEARGERGRRNSKIAELEAELANLKGELSRLTVMVADFKSGRHVAIGKPGMFDPRSEALQVGGFEKVGFAEPESFVVFGHYIHVAQPGETLFSIAKKYYGDENRFAALKAANQAIKNWDMIVGAQIAIPPIEGQPYKAQLRYVQEKTFGRTPPLPLLKVERPIANHYPRFYGKGKTVFTAVRSDNPKVTCELKIYGAGNNWRAYVLMLSESSALSAANGVFDMEFRSAVKRELGESSALYKQVEADLFRW